jgi:hypothetical protein
VFKKENGVSVADTGPARFPFHTKATNSARSSTQWNHIPCGRVLDFSVVRAVTYQSLNDSKHWRGRAEEMRTLADQMKDGDSRHMMLNLAADYDTLASRAEQRAKTSFNAPSPIRE